MNLVNTANKFDGVALLCLSTSICCGTTILSTASQVVLGCTFCRHTLLIVVNPATAPSCDREEARVAEGYFPIGQLIGIEILYVAKDAQHFSFAGADPLIEFCACADSIGYLSFLGDPAAGLTGGNSAAEQVDR